MKLTGLRKVLDVPPTPLSETPARWLELAATPAVLHALDLVERRDGAAWLAALQELNEDELDLFLALYQARRRAAVAR